MRHVASATAVLALAGSALFAAATPEITAPQPPATPVGARVCQLRMSDLRRGVDQQPGDAVLHNKLGVCLQQLGQPENARREYKQAIKLNAHYAEAYNNLGTLEHADGTFKAAAKLYRKALKLKPSLAAAQKNLGSAYLAMDKIDDALAAYREAARLDPTVLQSAGQDYGVTGVDAARQLYLFAKVAAATGHVDDALLLLARAQSMGFTDLARVRRDPDFRSVVKDARFATLDQ
jgi:tetratricopeptide (TPR) repeat protein